MFVFSLPHKAAYANCFAQACFQAAPHLPDYPVQSIYDIFSFEEEPAWPHGKWKVRLSDAAAEAILTRRDTEKKLISTRPGMIRLPDIVYEMEDAAPLGSKLEQNNWRTDQAV